MNTAVLATAFDEMSKALGHVPLGVWPTPIHRLPRLSAALGVEILVKRDDLSHALYGGNRLRQLEWVLADARRQGARSILTFGGVGSNYIVAIAAHASAAGIRCEGVVVDQPLTLTVRKNLLLATHFGARLHFAQTFPEAALVALREYFRITQRDRIRPYLVRPGAATFIGSLGYAFGGIELARQIQQGECPVVDRLFVAASSCGTVAGLMAGISRSDLDLPVTPVQAAESYVTNRFNIRHVCQGVLDLFQTHSLSARAAGPRKPPRIEICKDYLGACYGAPVVEAEEAVGVAREDGLELEGTYTGKAFAALLAWARNPRNRGKKVLFWNTYNSADVSAALTGVDWRDLSPRLWKYFDGSLPLAQPLDARR